MFEGGAIFLSLQRLILCSTRWPQPWTKMSVVLVDDAVLKVIYKIQIHVHVHVHVHAYNVLTL